MRLAAERPRSIKQETNKTPQNSIPMRSGSLRRSYTPRSLLKLLLLHATSVRDCGPCRPEEEKLYHTIMLHLYTRPSAFFLSSFSSVFLSIFPSLARIYYNFLLGQFSEPPSSALLMHSTRKNLIMNKSIFRTGYWIGEEEQETQETRGRTCMYSTMHHALP